MDIMNAHPCFQNAVSVKIVTDRETGRPRGFGYVQFQSEEDCEAAFNMSEQDCVEVNGRQLSIDFSGDKARKRAPGGGRGGGRGGGFRGGRGGGRGGYGGGFQQRGGYGGGGGFQQQG